jgi:cysteine desulfurase
MSNLPRKSLKLLIFFNFEYNWPMFQFDHLKDQRIYLDHNATTAPSLKVLDCLPRFMSQWGNPSSIHLSSRGPKNVLRETRKIFAEIFNCSPLEIIFNSGASEGNNTVLKSVWEKFGLEKNEYIISSVEHPCVIKTANYLETLGAQIHFVPVSREGVLDLKFIESKINSKTALISCMYANNETGTVFPLAEISKIAKNHNVLFHADCVQAMGKAPINLRELDLDYATFSGHKFYSLKGSGILYVKKNSPYSSLIHGGGQERGRRGGTENTLAIAALQVSLLDLIHLNENVIRMQGLRNNMETDILKKIPDVQITSQSSERLSNTSSLVISDVDGETLLMSLDIAGISVSTGAACSSGNPEPSPVLLAMGLSRKEAQNSLRVSLGWQTTESEIKQFITILVEVVQRIRQADSKSSSKGLSYGK